MVRWQQWKLATTVLAIYQLLSFYIQLSSKVIFTSVLSYNEGVIISGKEFWCIYHDEDLMVDTALFNWPNKTLVQFRYFK